VHDGQRQARIDPPSADDHRARAALAVIAALLGAGQMQVLAQCIEQRGARVEIDVASVAIHREGEHQSSSERRALCLGIRETRV
jgi:hypothetical protein